MPRSKGGQGWKLQSIARKARQRDQIEQPPEALKAADNFEWFRRWVCDQVTFPHQRDWLKEFNTGIDSNVLLGIAGDNTLVLSPRGSTKSTFLLQWVAWQVGRHINQGVELKVFYISYTIDVAADKSKQIQEILKLPRYRMVFPKVRLSRSIRSPRKWDVDRDLAGLTTIDEPYTLACAGLKGAIVSRRSHLAIFDDLIKSPKDIENPTIREQLRKNWTASIRPTMVHGSRAICLGTRMRLDDLYATNFNEEYGWKVITQKAIVTDAQLKEQSYCEVLAPLEGLQQMREEDEEAFEFQYQNQIPKNLDLRFKAEWLQYTQTFEDVALYDAIGVGIDLSASLRETADYTVFTLIGKIGADYHILDMRRGRWAGNLDKCWVLLGMLLEWGVVRLRDGMRYTINDYQIPVFETELSGADLYCPFSQVSVHVESKSYEISFDQDWLSFCDDLSLWSFMVFPDRDRGDKLLKLKSVTGLFQKGRVWFDLCSDFAPMLHELKLPLQTEHDDCLDSLVLGLRGMGGV